MVVYALPWKYHTPLWYLMRSTSFLPPYLLAQVRGLFLCQHKAAGGAGTGEALRHLRQGLSQSRGVQPGGRDGLPGDLISPGPKLLPLAHVGLELVLDLLEDACAGLLDELVQFISSNPDN